jgi:ATP-dependent exoDNAse (exonuclease V) beta subunit
MFKIYSSSAGSGKTYTLTKEYLKLALRPGASNDYFKHILAVTFTNAAANEMKDRILKNLMALATSEQEPPLLTVLVEELYELTPGTDAFELAKRELRQKADKVFKTILHRYADFSVTTIDSFTQRIVMAFTDELGLPYSFEVELETDEVLELAIDSLIEKAGVDEMDEITTILSEYYTHTAAEGNSWNQLPEMLKEFGRNLTSDQFYEAVNAAQTLTPVALRAIRTQLLDYNRQTAQAVVAHGQRAWKRITDAGLDEMDFSYGASGVGGFIKAVADGDGKKEGGARVANARDNSEWYSKKAGKPLRETIDGMADELTDCLVQIQAIQEDSSEQMILFDCVLPHLQKLALLRQMRIEFDELLRKDGRVHISEFNKKILGIVASEPVPFLFERLGAKYNHILVDEFQDTSRLQFANLMPLIENALGFQHFNLAVGDGKQAIYRFRGGDMDQIVALHRNDLESLKLAHQPGSWTAERIDALNGHIEQELLDTNWRSAEPIVTFNNEFFDFAARAFEGIYGKIADVFDAKREFQQKAQPNARQTGHVQIDFVARDDVANRDLTTMMLDKTVEHLKKALADGYQYGDIAILCRKKAHARALANALNNLRIPLVSADSLSLEFSDPVKWIVTVMQLLQRPDQVLLRYELLYLYHRVVKGIFPDDVLTEQLRAVADAVLIDKVYDYLAEEGYPLDPYALGQLNPYELAERLIHQFNLFEQAEHNPFLFRFLDEVLTFNQKRSGHLSDFLLYWESVREKISVEGDSRNAVSIQTIHKSKGLEYPVVIIPFANWDVTPNSRGTIWLDLSGVKSDLLAHQLGTGEITRLTSAPVHPKSDLKKTPGIVADQYTEEVTRTFLENMNLLYVAFTRPTNRLYIISEAKKDFDKKGDATKSSTIAHWLYAFLKDSDLAKRCDSGWQTDKFEYLISTCSDAFSHQPVSEIDEIVLDEVISGNRGQDLQLRRQADRVFDVATFARTREHDRKLQAALSLIKGADGLDKALRQLVRDGLLRISETAGLKQELTQLMAHPELVDLFDPTLRVDTDRNILSSRGSRRSHGAPHRVVHKSSTHVVLVQYASVSDNEAGDGSMDPTRTLRYFTDLYRQMGFAEAEGRLVYLAAEPIVVRVV